MQIPASTILSFFTGRLYSTTPPTVLFADMLLAATGRQHILTHELPKLIEDFAEKILAQCPDDFQKTVRDWQHTPDWESRVVLIDSAFGNINISICR